MPRYVSVPSQHLLPLVLACGVFAAATVAAPEVVRHAYKSTDARPLELVFYFPPDWTLDDRRPAVVLFFGGGFWTRNVDQFARQADYLARRGLVAILADYRTGEKDATKPPAAFEDARSAFRWVRLNAGKLGIDPARLAAGGGSAGGALAASLVISDGLDAPGEDRAVSTRPDALLLYNPGLNAAVNERTLTRYGDEATFRKTALALHPDLVPPPTLLLFGTEDNLLHGARTWAASAGARGSRIVWHLADGVGHGFFNFPPHLASTTEAVDGFLQDLGWLSAEPSVPLPEGEASLSESAGNPERGAAH